MGMKFGVGAALSLALGLTACGGPVAVKDITTNQDEYFNKKFTVSWLSTRIGSQFAAGSAPLGFKEIHVDEVATSTFLKTGTSHSDPVKLTLINDGDNGLVRLREESFPNQLPAGERLELSYRGMVSVMAQVINYNAAFSSAVLVKYIDKWPADLSTMKPNSNYQFQTQVGLEPQVVNFFTNTSDCRSSELYDARTLNATLEGKAFNMSCRYSRSNVDASLWTYAYLVDYGVGIVTEKKTTEQTIEYKISTISVR